MATLPNTKLINTKDVLPSIAQGRSAGSVHFIESGMKKSAILKDFPGVDLPHSRFAQELVAYQTAGTLNLKHWKFPTLRKVGVYQPEGSKHKHGLLKMSRVNGKSLAEFSNETHLFPQGTPGRTTHLEELSRGVEKIGEGLGELHGKSAMEIIVPATEIIETDSAKLLRCYEQAVNRLRKKGLSFSFDKKKVEGMIARFHQKPGKAGYAHGDVHFQNFIWDEATQELHAIDFGTMAQTITNGGKPRGIQAQDLSHMKVTTEFLVSVPD